MKVFALFVALFNFSIVTFAAEPWAYCDANGKAFKKVHVPMTQCPTPPNRPGEPDVLPGFHDPDLCTSTIETVNRKHPELDYICAYPTAAESGLDEARNTNRCINADKKHCVIGQGGVAGPGAHAIPGEAWYKQTGVSEAYPYIRCQCGCFIGETLISSPAGAERIDLLAEKAKAMPLGVLQFSTTKGQSPSKPLRGSDFTVGPEDKPVIRIATQKGAELTVTGLHPIFVQRNGTTKMVQAQDLSAGDILMAEDGNPDEVFSLESYKLDLASDKVYNLDTKAQDPEDHIISANQILVGDIYWQKRLSEDTGRAENLLNAALQ